MDRAKLQEAVLEVTGGESWNIVLQSLESEIRNLQVRALQAESWEEVCSLRGKAEAFVQIYNMRENTKLEKNQDAL